MGCKQMDAVTYSNPAVKKFVEDSVIPVKARYDQPLAKDFTVKWTPTLVLLDSEGKEAYRSEGYLPPDSLIPALSLGIGKIDMQHAKYDRAIQKFEQITSRFPDSEEAPEAIYFLGVSRFKSTGDLKAMKGAYEKLAGKYPTSSWTKKAQPYSALK